MIFISTDKAGGRDAAIAKAQTVCERAKHGESFADLAGNPQINDDPLLVRKKGAVGEKDGWMEKDAYAVEKVDQAVWQLHPSDVSTPISAPDRGQDGFWIAKLEAINNGESKPFESQQVQAAIHEVLWREQFARLRAIHIDKLVHEAVWYENKDVREVMKEMVMQRYKSWTAER